MTAGERAGGAGAAGCPRFDAVVLAGGRGSRLGGVDKAGIRIDGARLVDRVASAASRVGASRVVVVGPDRAAVAGGLTVREDPPFSGPLAAVAAALPLVDADWVLLLSCDLEHPDAVCERLADAWARVASPADGSKGSEPSAAAPSVPLDGVLLQDAEGRTQWLAGLYRASTLRRRAEELGDDLADRPLRQLFAGAELLGVETPSWETADIDEPDDLERAGAET